MSPKPSDAAPRRGLAAWALFEWARNPYVLLVTVYIYAPYFSVSLMGDPVRGQVEWAKIVGYGGVAVALLAPFLGAIADAGGRRKPWVLFFTLLLIGAECALWLPQPGGPHAMLLAGVAVVLASVAYDFSQVFHGALLASLVPPERAGRLSGLGYGLGNIAGLILLVTALALFYLPEHPLLGLDRTAHEHQRIVGPLCAVWLAIFAIPFFLFTPDTASGHKGWLSAVTSGLSSVARTIKSLRNYRNVALYLIGRAFYNDGTVAMLSFGGVYAAGVFGWSEIALAAYGILLSPFAAFGGYFGGRLADRIGARRTILIGLFGTIVGAIASLGFGPDHIFFVVKVTPGVAVWSSPVFKTLPEILYLVTIMFVAVFIVSIWANSRTMLARTAPVERMTEFFGLYALSGNATAFLAPFAVEWVTSLTGSQQWGLGAIVGFLTVGFVFMLGVKETRATAV